MNLKTLIQGNLAQRLWKRLSPFADVGFWVLTLISLVPLLLLNWAMAVTLLQWSAFLVAFAGASIVVCRILLPQVDLTEYLERVKAGTSGTGAGLVVLSVCLLLSTILLAMVLWAKA